MKDFARYSQPNEVDTDPLGLFVCVEWSLVEGRQGVGWTDKQMHTGEVVLDLNVFCQIEYQTFYAEDNKEAGWHTCKVQMR